MSWNPDFPLPQGDKWNLPCARNCVRNTLTRLFMHRQWWVNDPDCLMLRDKLSFSLDEIRGIATAKALSGGSFIISDDLKMISPERMRIALQLMPPAPVAAVAVDLLERETPELFRMQLRSNFAHDQLHAVDVEENGHAHKDANFSPDANVTPEKPSRARRDSSTSSMEFIRPGQVRFQPSSGGLCGIDDSPVKRATSSPNIATRGEGGGHVRQESTDSGVGLSTSATNLQSLSTLSTHNVSAIVSNIAHIDVSCNSPQQRLPGALVGSPRGSKARHSQERGLIFEVGADLNLLRRERRKVKEFLKEENVSNEDDLLGEYTLFTVCNWAQSSKKDHFLSVRQIFGEEFVAQLVARGVLVNNLIKLQRASANNKARREQRLLSGNSTSGHHRQLSGSGRDREGKERSSNISPERLQRGISQLVDTPRYLMHLFNFWTEHYSYRVVTLEEAEDSEVAFLNVPPHSAHIYSVSLTTDPTLPKYVGSNLHFSCGSELHRIYLTAVSVQAEMHLKSVLLGQDLDPFDDLNSPPQNFEPDFTFSDGFGPSDAENPFGDSAPHQHRHGLRHLDEGPTLTPIVRSMCVSFEEGALRDAAWGGYIWLFLPVNGLNPRMTHSSFGRIHVSGPAVEGLSSSSSSSQQDQQARRGISSQRAEESNVRLEKHVRAPDCRIFGDVYRIAVCRSNGNSGSDKQGATSSPDRRNSAFFFTNETSTRHTLSRTSSHQDVTAEGKDHIIVSWVYDVRETHTRGSVV